MKDETIDDTFDGTVRNTFFLLSFFSALRVSNCLLFSTAELREDLRISPGGNMARARVVRESPTDNIVVFQYFLRNLSVLFIFGQHYSSLFILCQH